jgi:hypothetical protein
MSLALRLQLLLVVACVATWRTEALLTATAALALIAMRELVRRHVCRSALRSWPSGSPALVLSTPTRPPGPMP